MENLARDDDGDGDDDGDDDGTIIRLGGTQSGLDCGIAAGCVVQVVIAWMAAEVESWPSTA